MSGAPRVAFLDRDGVLNAKASDGEYVTQPEELVILPGAARAVRMLNDLGSLVVVITNQRGIALGRMSEQDLDAVHAAMKAALSLTGAHLDGVFHCPHDIGTCRCRKPDIGLFTRARQELPGVVLDDSVMIGDSRSDMEAARRLGIRRILVADPQDPGIRSLAVELDVDLVAPSLLDAVERLRATR